MTQIEVNLRGYMSQLTQVHDELKTCEDKVDPYNSTVAYSESHNQYMQSITEREKSKKEESKILQSKLVKENEDFSQPNALKKKNQSNLWRVGSNRGSSRMLYASSQNPLMERDLSFARDRPRPLNKRFSIDIDNTWKKEVRDQRWLLDDRSFKKKKKKTTQQQETGQSLPTQTPFTQALEKNTIMQQEDEHSSMSGSVGSHDSSSSSSSDSALSEADTARLPKHTYHKYKFGNDVKETNVIQAMSYHQTTGNVEENVLVSDTSNSNVNTLLAMTRSDSSSTVSTVTTSGNFPLFNNNKQQPKKIDMSMTKKKKHHFIYLIPVQNQNIKKNANKKQNKMYRL